MTTHGLTIYLRPIKCSHMARGIIVQKGVLSVSDLFVDPLGYCAEIAPDEKFYYGIVQAKEEGERSP